MSHPNTGDELVDFGPQESDVPVSDMSASAAALQRATSNVPFRHDPDFVGRSEIIKQIDLKLAMPAGMAALVGLSGVGCAPCTHWWIDALLTSTQEIPACG